MPKVKLFCIPYAGGSAQMYHSWMGHVHPAIELCPVELSGRGQRFNDPLYNNFDELIDDVFQQIETNIQETPYAFFGHSLGALIAFELVHKIKDNKLPLPKHVFYSGKSAPNLENKRKMIYHLLEPAQFKEELMKLGGTSRVVFENKELEELFLPIIKNDFKLAETYQFKEGRSLYGGEITVFLGKEDELTAEQCHQWSNCTSGTCKLIYVNGGHFFINHQAATILNIVNNTLVK